MINRNYPEGTIHLTVHLKYFLLIKRVYLRANQKLFMKKIFFAAIAAAICIASCNDAGTTNKDSDAKQKNLAASNAISNAFQTGNVNAIESFIADDFVDHSDRGDVKGKDSLKAMVKFTHENMKDMKQEKIHELADDDYVFSWMRWTGTSNGS